jgi:hypothetical protein
MADYSKGKIYTLRCRTDDTKVYVGSTIHSLCDRLARHKIDSKQGERINSKLYATINNDWENWYIELYELCPCESKEALCRREGEVIREIGTLNKMIAGRTKKEYREDHKEEIKIRCKEWYENNKERKAQKTKEYYEKNKERIQEQAKARYLNKNNLCI